MSVIKNVDGSENSLLYELNSVVNSGEFGYNQSNDYIDHLYRRQTENKFIKIVVRDREFVKALLSIFIPGFNMNNILLKLGYSSIILFRKKVDRSHSDVDLILQMLYQFDPKSHVVIKYPKNIKIPQEDCVSTVKMLEPFIYKEQYYFCAKINGFRFIISPLCYGEFFETRFTYSSPTKEKFEKFLKESDIITFIKRNRDNIKLSRILHKTEE